MNCACTYNVFLAGPIAPRARADGSWGFEWPETTEERVLCVTCANEGLNGEGI